PANYAAKLAEGEEPGIYVSSRVRILLVMDLPVSGLMEERKRAISAVAVEGAIAGLRVAAESSLVVKAVQEVEACVGHRADLPKFVVHHQEPPLRTIDFALVSASNAVLMELLSIFGDIDGFTAYVDSSLHPGGVGDMVAN